MDVPTILIDKATGIHFRHSCGHYRYPTIAKFSPRLIGSRFEGGTLAMTRGKPKPIVRYFDSLEEIAEFSRETGEDWRYTGVFVSVHEFVKGKGREAHIKRVYDRPCPACEHKAACAHKASKQEVVEVKKVEMKPELVVAAPKKTRGWPKGKPRGKKQEIQSKVTFSVERNNQKVEWSGSMSEFSKLKKVRGLPAVHACGHCHTESAASLKGLKKESFFDKYVEVYSNECPDCFENGSIVQDAPETHDLFHGIDSTPVPESIPATPPVVSKPIIMSAAAFIATEEEDGVDKELEAIKQEEEEEEEEEWSDLSEQERIGYEGYKQRVKLANLRIKELQADGEEVDHMKIGSYLMGEIELGEI